jgi:UDP-N-acetylmuramoyl-tripeptide--D-alanyl-D-alanine ligase
MGKSGSRLTRAMEPRSLQYIAQAAEGELRHGTPTLTVSRVCTDSRQAKPGDVFVALRGDRFDGHDFVEEVVRRGAVALVVGRDRVPASDLGAGVVAVDDPRKALGRLAARYRQDFHLPVVAVGGSNGKTTTKDLLGAVLGERFRTLCSQASFNNDVGVPLTLLNLEPSHQVAVVELGTNHPGELAPLARMTRPRYAVVTSLGREHLEFFENLEGVVREEGWLAELLPAEGCLFVPGDNPAIAGLVERAPAPTVRVGLGPGNDWRAGRVTLDAAGADFEIQMGPGEFLGLWRVNLVGRHQVTNALLALAVAAELGLTAEDARRGLAGCRAARRRLEVWTADGVRVLDDAYNANADSVRAALETLQDFPCEGRRVAVLGDMAELGKESPAAHAEVGRFAAERGVDQLFAVGRMAGVMGSAARAAGLMRVIELPAAEVAAAAVGRFVRGGDVVLVKASRATGLEQVSDALRRRAEVS